MLAGRTLTPSRRPSVSTRMWRSRPVTFLPHRSPEEQPMSPFWAALALWESMIASFGLASRPAPRGPRHKAPRGYGPTCHPNPTAENRNAPCFSAADLSASLPLAAGHEHIEDSVAAFALVDRPTPSDTPGRRNERSDQHPLGVAQVTRITKAAVALARRCSRFRMRALPCES